MFSFNIDKTKRNEYIFLGSIFVFAFCLRLIYTLQIQTLPTFTVLIVDAFSYNEWAKNIIQNSWLGDKVFYQAPLYPYFIALIYKIFGIKLFAVRIIQVLMGSATCLLYYYISKKIWGVRAGVIASLLATFYSIYIFYVPLHLKPTLYIFLETSCILLLCLCFYEKKKRYFIASGVLLGLMVFTRGNTLLIVPFLLIWVFLSYNFKTAIRNYLLILAGLLLILFPVIIRNYVVSGDFVITTSQAGPNFYIGNNLKATGSYVPLIPGHQTPEFEGADARMIAEKELGRELKPSEVSRYWFTKSFDYIKNNKFHYSVLMWKKITLMFNYYEVPDSEDFYFYRQYSSILRLPLIPFGVICPLAFLGMLLLIKDYKKYSLLYVLVIANFVSIIIFYIFSRYRLPIVPLFIIFSSYAIHWFANEIKQKEWRKPLLFGIICILFYLFSHIKMNDPKSNLAVSHSNMGISYKKLGDTSNAKLEYEKAIKVDPDCALAHYNLGNIYREEGLIKDAIKEYKTVVNITPRDIEAHYNLGIAYQEKGLIEHAIKEYKMVIKTDPNHVSTLNNLGTAYAIKGKLYKAIAHWKRVLEIDPEDTAAYDNITRATKIINKK
jgi:tetratricopeptide (TPR) repeat protein